MFFRSKFYRDNYYCPKCAAVVQARDIEEENKKIEHEKRIAKKLQLKKARIRSKIADKKLLEELENEKRKQLEKAEKKSYTRKEDRFNNLYPLTSLIHPCYHNKSIFDIMENTNLLEGDLIRFFRQILDRINQIKKATKDERLKQMLRSCQDLILNCLRDIDTV